MRLFSLIAVVLLPCGALAGDFSYIVPITGVARSDAFYVGHVNVLNPGPLPATVRVDDLLRMPFAPPCTPTAPITLNRGEYALVGAGYSGPICDGVYALVLRSDRPVTVRARVTTISGSLFGEPESRIDVAERWIEPGEEALIVGVAINKAFFWRANLVLVNPEDHEIEVAIRLTHTQFHAARAETVRVPARSVILHSLAEIENPQPPTGFPTVIFPEHDLLLSANGRFQAGAASIRDVGVTRYRGAVILSHE